MRHQHGGWHEHDHDSDSAEHWHVVGGSDIAYYPGQHDDCIATTPHYHDRPYKPGDWSAEPIADTTAPRALAELVAQALHDSRFQAMPTHDGTGSKPFEEPVVPCGWCRTRAADFIAAFREYGLIDRAIGAAGEGRDSDRDGGVDVERGVAYLEELAEASS